jgi:hypothetical protein
LFEGRDSTFWEENHPWWFQWGAVVHYPQHSPVCRGSNNQKELVLSRGSSPRSKPAEIGSGTDIFGPPPILRRRNFLLCIHGRHRVPLHAFHTSLRLTIPLSTRSAKFKNVSSRISISIQNIDGTPLSTSSFPSLCTQYRVSHMISSVISSYFPAPSCFEKSSATT